MMAVRLLPAALVLIAAAPAAAADDRFELCATTAATRWGMRLSCR